MEKYPEYDENGKWLMMSLVLERVIPNQ